MTAVTGHFFEILFPSSSHILSASLICSSIHLPSGEYSVGQCTENVVFAEGAEGREGRVGAGGGGYC